MRSMPRSALQALLSLLLLPFLSGCSLEHFSDPSTSSSVLPATSGDVHGGQQPVSGSVIQLYAANILANKGASTPLLLTSVTTDANGNFSIPAGYVCPTPNSPVYITSTGGNPGLAAGTNNPGITLMGALGTCSSLLTAPAGTQIVINELTTVAALEALAPFMSDLTHMGADLTANPNALSTAFANSQAIVSIFNGQFAAVAAGTPALPRLLYNTLANILASCINTAGNTGSASNCYKLYAATGNTVNDAAGAMLYIAQHAAANTAAFFALAGGTGAPFQPQMTAPPPDFTVGLVINIPNTGEYRCCTYQQLAIDTSQQIWVGNQFTKGVHVYSNAGVPIRTITLPFPLDIMSADPFGNIWFIVDNVVGYPYRTILKYSPSGTLLSPANGWQIDQGASSQVFSYLTNGSALRFDSLGNFWTTGTQAGSGKFCALKFTSTATFVVAACPSAFNSYHAALAIDASDNVYLANFSLFKFSPAGLALFTTPPALNSINNTWYMHYDPVTDHIWVFDSNEITIYASSGAVVKPHFADSLNFTNPFGLDGAGNAIGSSGYPIGISEFDPTGTLISPFLGYQSYNALTTVVKNFEVDGAGNIWATGGDNVLARVSGLAVPRTQYFR